MESEIKQSPEPSLEGIRGWLILPLLGLIIAPFRLSFFLYQTYWPIFSEGYWSVLTTPTGEAYHRLWAALLIFEVVGNLALLIFGLVALRFFLKKSHLTPALVIAWLASSLVFIAADFFLVFLIPAVAGQPDAESAKQLGGAIFDAIVWIPYFLISKRVKATFVK